MKWWKRDVGIDLAYWRSFEKANPTERRGRKVTGLRGLPYDSGIAETVRMLIRIRASQQPLLCLPFD